MSIFTCFGHTLNEKFENYKKIKFLSRCDKKFFPLQMQVLLGYLLQKFLLTTSQVFVTANTNGEVGNNWEVVSHFAIKLWCFVCFDINRHPAKFDVNRERKIVELTTLIETIENLASRFEWYLIGTKIAPKKQFGCLKHISVIRI